MATFCLMILSDLVIYVNLNYLSNSFHELQILVKHYPACLPHWLRSAKKLALNGSKLRIFKNLNASQVAVLLTHSHPTLTEQRVFALGGELWEVFQLQLGGWDDLDGFSCVAQVDVLQESLSMTNRLCVSCFGFVCLLLWIIYVVVVGLFCCCFGFVLFLSVFVCLVGYGYSFVCVLVCSFKH